MAKGLRKPIARLTDTREDKKLQRAFVDLSGKMAVPNIGGNGKHLLCGMITHYSHECTF